MSEFMMVCAPDDGLRRAMADARGRRFRTAGVSTSLCAALLSVVAVVAGGGGTQSLVQQPAPDQPAVTVLVPDPGPARDSGGARPNVAPATGTRATVSAVSLLGTAGGVASSTTDTALTSGQAARRTASRPYVAGSLSRADNQPYVPTDTSCNVTGKTEDATTLCPASTVYTQTSPTPYQLYAQVCSTRTSTTTLHFAGRNEVDMVVSRAGRPVWRWSQWHPDGGPAHTVDVLTGACSEWAFDWTGVDAEGRALPKGDYTLTVTFLAAELTGRSSASYAFTL